MPAADDEITLGEVNRTLNRFMDQTQRSFKALDDRLGNNLVDKGSYEARHQALVDRVNWLEKERRAEQTARRNMTLGVIVAILGSVGGVLASVVH